MAQRVRPARLLITIVVQRHVVVVWIRINDPIYFSRKADLATHCPVANVFDYSSMVDAAVGRFAQCVSASCISVFADPNQVVACRDSPTAEL